MANFAEILGKTLIRFEGKAGDELIKMTFSDGSVYAMYHCQDCCERVYIESIIGDICDLIGCPLLLAEESISEKNQNGKHKDVSFTWTFYKLATIKGYVDIRWYGKSNGAYSESVDFERIA